MAAYTVQRSGNWNDASGNASSPWYDGGAQTALNSVPGSGDTVANSNSAFTLTIPLGYTAVCGTSPTSNIGTVALTINGPLVVNGTLKWQGPVKQGDATVTVGPGGTLTYDASGAATPATALYSWEIGTNSSQANAKLVFNGTSGSRCTVNSVGNVPCGPFGINSVNWADAGRVEASYTDFSYIGKSGGVFAIASRLASSTGRLILDHCTFDSCGTVGSVATALSADCTVQITNCRFTNPADTSYTLYLDCSTAKTTGVRKVHNCDIAGRAYFLDTGGVATGADLMHNIFRPSSPGASSPNDVLTFPSGGSASAWDQNMLAVLTGAAFADPAARLPACTMTASYLYRQVGTSYSNAHPLYGKAVGGDLIADGWVAQYTGSDVNSDIFELSGDGAAGKAFKIANSVFLPNAAGLAAGSFVNNSSGASQTNTTIVCDHNTLAAGIVSNDGNVYGIGAEASGTSLPAGSIPSARSNLLWRASSGPMLLVNSSATATVSDGAVTAADYNDAFNASSSIYGNPSGQFAATPGTHDLSVDPQFVDSARSLLNFDQGYLGNPVATGWATSTAYAVGDVASNSDAGFYGGATYNYRCVSAHTSDATTKPGSGASWSQYWEPAALKLISDDVIAGNTYSGGTNSLVGELVAWVKAGFTPRNAALATAAHDGGTVGAVAYAAAFKPAWAVRSNQIIGGGF